MEQSRQEFWCSPDTESTQNMTRISKPDVASSGPFLVDQGVFFFCRRSPCYCSLGGKCCDSLAIILSNYVWGIYNVQPSTATFNAAIKAESVWVLPLMNCWTSRYRLDRPSIAHPLAAAPAFTNHRKSSFATHVSLGAQTCRIWPFVVCDWTMTDRLHCWLRPRGTK